MDLLPSVWLSSLVPSDPHPDPLNQPVSVSVPSHPEPKAVLIFHRGGRMNSLTWLNNEEMGKNLGTQRQDILLFFCFFTHLSLLLSLAADPSLHLVSFSIHFWLSPAPIFFPFISTLTVIPFTSTLIFCSPFASFPHYLLCCAWTIVTSHCACQLPQVKTKHKKSRLLTDGRR